MSDNKGNAGYTKTIYNKDQVDAAMQKAASEILAAAKNMMPAIKFKGKEMHGRRKP